MNEKYLTEKTPLGLAIISWELDEDYIRQNESDDDSIFYMINLEIYNLENELTYEDMVGGVWIEAAENTKDFRDSILEACKYTWDEAFFDDLSKLKECENEKI